MLKGIHAGDSGFLIQLNRVENRIAVNNNQITSGIRVSQAQDDPFAVQSILSFQNQLDQLNQLQTNLNIAKNTAGNADSALATTSNILNQLVSIGSQGASDLTTPTSRANLAIQADQLAQQIVGIANTQVGSTYVFGGDQPTTPPYKLDTTVVGYATSTSNAGSTAVLRDASGTTQQAGMTAKQIFDLRDASGNPISGNIFQATYALAQALKANDTTATTTALGQLKAGIDHLAGATVFYGNLQDWVQTANDQSTSQANSLTQSISGLRDTDVPAAITQMTSDQTSLQAAISAHASLSNKTLFDYIG